MTDHAALVLASHGTSDPAGRRAVAALVEAATRSMREEGSGQPVSGCFVDVQQPDVPVALAGLPEGVPAVIVPLLLSAGYHVHVDLQDAASGASGPVTVTGALGPDDRLAGIQAARLGALGLRPDDVVVMAAAGSSDSSAVDDCERAGRLLAAALGRPVAVGYLSAAHPRLREAVDAARVRAGGARVVVSTYLLAPGYFASLVEDCGADAVTAPLLADREPPAAELVEVVLDRFRSSLLIGSLG